MNESLIHTICSYKDCQKHATGRCEGTQTSDCCTFESSEKLPFAGECRKYFCTDHLKWGWGILNCGVAGKQCPDHHTGIYCCTIL